MGFAPSQWWERASLHFWECSWQTKYWTERGISEAPSRISSFHKQTVSFLQFSRCAGCGEQQPRWGMRHFLLGFCSSLSLFSLDNAADGTCINKQGCSFSCGKPAALFWLFNTTDRVLIHRIESNIKPSIRVQHFPDAEAKRSNETGWGRKSAESSASSRQRSHLLADSSIVEDEDAQLWTCGAQNLPTKTQSTSTTTYSFFLLSSFILRSILCLKNADFTRGLKSPFARTERAQKLCKHSGNLLYEFFRDSYLCWHWKQRR